MTEYDPDDLTSRRALAEALVEALTKAGFAHDADAPGEVTYTRAGPRDRTVLKVYTTIPKDGKAVRGNGKDAIRVCGVYQGDERSRGLAKERRVHRTGMVEAIVERTLERARDAWRAVKHRPRCVECGTIMFTSRAGKEVCAAICWDRANKSEAASV